MAGKIFEFALRINAAMQGNLERSVAGVSKEMRKLMSDSNRLASEYNRLEANLRNNAGVINSSSSAYARLDSAYRTGLISQSAYAAGTQRLENNIRQATNNLQRYEAELNRVAIAQRQNQHNQAQLSFQEHAGRTVGSYQNMMGAVNFNKTHSKRLLADFSRKPFLNVTY